jgi:hypothetical protein
MKILTSIDYLGKSPELFINSGSSYKSTLGGILTVIVTTLQLLGTIYFVNLLLSGSQFSVNQSDEPHPDSLKNWKNEELAIMITDKIINPIPNQDRIFTMTAIFYKDTPRADAQGKITYSVETSIIKTEPCKLDVHFTEGYDLWKQEKNLNVSTCFGRDQDFNSTKTHGATGFSGLVIWISRCVNTTEKKDCLPPADIEKNLENIFILVRKKDIYFNHNNNRDEVATPYIYSEAVSTSSTVFKRIFYTIRNIDYESDEGLIITDWNTYKFSAIASSKESVDLRTTTTIPGSFAAASFYQNGYKLKFKRTYYKGQNMLADAGGLFKGILTLATVLNIYFCETSFYQAIFSSLGSALEQKPTQSFEIPHTENLEDKSLSTNKVLRSKEKEVKSSRKFKKIDLTKNSQKQPEIKLNTVHFLFPLSCFNTKKGNNSNVFKFMQLTTIYKSKMDVKNLFYQLIQLDHSMKTELKDILSCTRQKTFTRSSENNFVTQPSSSYNGSPSKKLFKKKNTE